MMSLPDTEVGRNNNVRFRTEARDFTFSNGVLKGPEDQMRSINHFVSTRSAFNVMLC